MNKDIENIRDSILEAASHAMDDRIVEKADQYGVDIRNKHKWSLHSFRKEGGGYSAEFRYKGKGKLKKFLVDSLKDEDTILIVKGELGYVAVSSAPADYIDPGVTLKFENKPDKKYVRLWVNDETSSSYALCEAGSVLTKAQALMRNVRTFTPVTEEQFKFLRELLHK